jgi:hypothetical protein
MKGRLTLRRLIIAETTWGTAALDVQTSDMRTLGTGSDIALHRTVRLTRYLLSLTPVPVRRSASPVVGGHDGLLRYVHLLRLCNTGRLAELPTHFSTPASNIPDAAA